MSVMELSTASDSSPNKSAKARRSRIEYNTILSDHYNRFLRITMNASINAAHPFVRSYGKIKVTLRIEFTQGLSIWDQNGSTDGNYW